MARSLSLVELRSTVLARADMESAELSTPALFTPVEVNEYINGSIAELYRQLALKDDYYTTPYTFTTSSTESAYDLPDDFWLARSVVADTGETTTLKLRRFSADVIGTVANGATWCVGGRAWYRVVGSEIHVHPRPGAAYPVTLWYVPAPPKLVGELDELDGVAGFEEFVILDAAVKCVMKEEGDISALVAQRELVRQRVLEDGSTRDASEPNYTQDVVGWDRYG